MRHAILADIHSNLEAFKAVLVDAEIRGGFDQIWCLGDIVGYGPDPCECIELLRQHDHVCVAGNNDWASIGKVDTYDFNPEAAIACRSTFGRLGSDEIDYLSNLPKVLTQNDFTLVHGSPRDPLWEYVMSTTMVRLNLNHFDTMYCLIGHSHVPQVYAYDKNADECRSHALSDGGTFNLIKQRFMINPGSVGQPRDGNPKASYMIYDSDEHTITHF
ncbi:MAG: metallophosphoesterase family protein, partial [Chloroflexi bacterium]|nr:metallophosphoesterase family protein [Chloroflexota bacterium]